MKPSIFLSAVVLAVGAVTLSGCGSKADQAPVDETPAQSAEAQSAGEQSADAEDPAGKEAESDDPVMQYGSLLATLDPEKMAEAQDLTVPGSNAYGFAVYYQAVTQSDIDAGFDHTGFTIEENDDGFTICNYDSECSEYSDFEYEDEKIANFSIEGVPLDGRVMVGDGSAQPLGEYGEVSLVSAFLRSNGEMRTLWEYEPNTDNVWLAAVWQSPEGEEVEAATRASPEEIHAGDNLIYGLFFDDVEFDGLLGLFYGVDGEWEDTPVLFDMVAIGSTSSSSSSE